MVVLSHLESIVCVKWYYLFNGTRQIDRQCLFILHGQRKDPEVIKVSRPWVSHYAYSAATAAF